MNSYYLHYVWNEVVPKLYSKKIGCNLKEAKDHVLREYNRIGRDDVRWYLPRYWFKRFDLGEDPLEVFKTYSDEIRFYPEVPSVLESLKQKYDLIAASGIPRNIVEIIVEDFGYPFKHIFSPVSDLQEVKKTPRTDAPSHRQGVGSLPGQSVYTRGISRKNQLTG